MSITLILARADNGVIGRNGAISLGHISDDLRRFKALTMGGIVVMGRKTWDSVAQKAAARTAQYCGDAPDGLGRRGGAGGHERWSKHSRRCKIFS